MSPRQSVRPGPQRTEGSLSGFASEGAGQGGKACLGIFRRFPHTHHARRMQPEKGVKMVNREKGVLMRLVWWCSWQSQRDGAGRAPAAAQTEIKWYWIVDDVEEHKW